MESNIISFIMENIIIFLVLGSLGIGTTIYLYFTGKKTGNEEKDNIETDYIKISNFSLNIFVLVYLFIFIMMILIGIFSDFIIPTIISAVLAIIPIILLLFIKIISNKIKV